MSIITKSLVSLGVIFFLSFSWDDAMANAVDHHREPVQIHKTDFAKERDVCALAQPHENNIDTDLMIYIPDAQHPDLRTLESVPYSEAKQQWVLDVPGFLPTVIKYVGDGTFFELNDGMGIYYCPNPSKRHY